MIINGAKILVLGGWGLVGSAIIHRLHKHSPKKVIVTSLRRSEAEDAVQHLQSEYPDVPPGTFEAWWGNVFVRTEWKDTARENLLSDPSKRRALVHDITDDITDSQLRDQALFSLLDEHRPDIVIDCINTATAIAYQDIYSSSQSLVDSLGAGQVEAEQIERLLASLYIPQLVRHIQILHRSMRATGVKMYLKVGTSGTGGMGLNIPYTHSEEKPSRVLLSKSAVAGAQSMLLFLMARTPEGPIIKEVKPSATIAWKSIAYGDIWRKGKPIASVDMQVSQARDLQDGIDFDDVGGIERHGRALQSVYIDTGENGIFSRAEFETVSSVGQMELVTPEEIAHVVVTEVLGGNTGREIIQGLDSTVMGPTYRGGSLRSTALEHLRRLEKEHGIDSIGFELLGPPRLTKLLYEAHILRCINSSPAAIVELTPQEIALRADHLLSTNHTLRTTILSVGLPVLLSSGRQYLRGDEVLIPVTKPSKSEAVSDQILNKWCHDGWIDLRPNNMLSWQERFTKIRSYLDSLPIDTTSSRYEFDRNYWMDFNEIDEGKIASYILHHEERGTRLKR